MLYFHVMMTHGVFNRGCVLEVGWGFNLKTPPHLENPTTIKTDLIQIYKMAKIKSLWYLITGSCLKV